MHPTTPASWEETLMSSYVNTKCYNKYYPTNGNNDVDLLLKAIYLFDNKNITKWMIIFKQIYWQWMMRSGRLSDRTELDLCNFLSTRLYLSRT